MSDTEQISVQYLLPFGEISVVRAAAWDRTRLDAWLRSPSSPLGRKANPEIRTLADANKVRWALKRMRARQQKQVSA